MQSIFSFSVKNVFFITTVLLFLLAPNLCFIMADDYTSSHFIVRDPVITVNGGQSSSSLFQFISSTGQVATGQSLSLNFIYKSGFLYFGADSQDDDDDDGGGGGGSVGGGGASIYNPPIFPPNVLIPSSCETGVDLNCDGSIDIIDLSIFLYYADTPYNERYDFNKDGKINLVDISILLFYWT